MDQLYDIDEYTKLDEAKITIRNEILDSVFREQSFISGSKWTENVYIRDSLSSLEKIRDKIFRQAKVKQKHINSKEFEKDIRRVVKQSEIRKSKAQMEERNKKLID